MEASSEIMREIIAKMVIDDKSYKPAGKAVSPSKNGQPKKEINKESINKPKKVEIMSYESTINILSERAKVAKPLGSVLKLNFGDSQIVIDGTSEANNVSSEDTEANCTVDVSLDDFTAMMKGELNPMNAFMSGKMKVKGDMGVAMKLQSIMS